MIVQHHTTSTSLVMVSPCSNPVAFRDTMSPFENMQATEELPRETKRVMKCLDRVRRVFHKKQKVVWNQSGNVPASANVRRLSHQSRVGTAFR